MKKEQRKHMLHKNDIKEVNGQIIRYGNGSYYQINHQLLKWFIARRITYSHKHTPDFLIIDQAKIIA